MPIISTIFSFFKTSSGIASAIAAVIAALVAYGVYEHHLGVLFVENKDIIAIKDAEQKVIIKQDNAKLNFERIKNDYEKDIDALTAFDSLPANTSTSGMPPFAASATINPKSTGCQPSRISANSQKIDFIEALSKIRDVDWEEINGVK